MYMGNLTEKVSLLKNNWKKFKLDKAKWKDSLNRLNDNMYRKKMYHWIFKQINSSPTKKEAKTKQNK